MARRCTTVPGYGTCCRAASQGLLGRPFQMTDSRGSTRCAQCDTVAKTKGRGMGFRFRWHKNQECGIGPHGCPYLGAQGQGQLQIGGPVGSGNVLNP